MDQVTGGAAPQVFKGLVGVHADVTAVSKVMPETNSLTYRGYAVQDLAEQCRFEEVAHLLLNGELPNRRQLTAFQKAERENRGISKILIRVIEEFPRKAHPMDATRTAVSFLGMEDPEGGDTSIEATRRKALRLYAKIPTVIAAISRLRKGRRPIRPKPELGFSENLFHMFFGRVPDPEIVKAFDVSMTLYAEHSFNASTFAARVVASTQADIHAAVTAGIAALKGPLHGGANEAVMHMLKEVGTPARARGWIDDRLEHRALVMGFGHRVYRKGDSRVPTMSKYRDIVAERLGGRKWLEISTILAEEMLAKKSIHPNLDFPTGPTYHLMGFDIPMFTPLFVASRITGWAAHVLEQMEDNRLIRPLSHYVGVPERPVPPMKAR
ncbi:MAG: bifunctional 2-methylcitrate synthase/citrate synthase [Acetobacteraceae bacterium]